MNFTDVMNFAELVRRLRVLGKPVSEHTPVHVHAHVHAHVHVHVRVHLGAVLANGDPVTWHNMPICQYANIPILAVQ